MKKTELIYTVIVAQRRNSNFGFYFSLDEVIRPRGSENFHRSTSLSIRQCRRYLVGKGHQVDPAYHRDDS